VTDLLIATSFSSNPSDRVEVARAVVTGSNVEGDAGESPLSCLFLGEDHRRCAVATAAIGLVDIDVVHDQGRLIRVATLDQPQVAHQLAFDLDHEHGVFSRPMPVDLRHGLRLRLIYRHPVVADQILSVVMPQQRQPSDELFFLHRAQLKSHATTLAR
jgi:hypothetical protein